MDFAGLNLNRCLQETSTLSFQSNITISEFNDEAIIANDTLNDTIKEFEACTPVPIIPVLFVLVFILETTRIGVLLSRQYIKLSKKGRILPRPTQVRSRGTYKIRI